MSAPRVISTSKYIYEGAELVSELHARLVINMIFEVFGGNKNYIEFYHTARAAAARARGPCDMARQLEAT